MFDWQSYFDRIADDAQREYERLIRGERRLLAPRSITNTIRSCAPLLPRRRTSRPRDPRAAS